MDAVILLWRALKDPFCAHIIPKAANRPQLQFCNAYRSYMKLPYCEVGGRATLGVVAMTTYKAILNIALQLAVCGPGTSHKSKCQCCFHELVCCASNRFKFSLLLLKDISIQGLSFAIEHKIETKRL